MRRYRQLISISLVTLFAGAKSFAQTPEEFTQTPQISAQTPEELVRLDPGELYYQAYVLVKEAEEHEKRGQLSESFGKYRKAHAFFHMIQITQPSFRAEGVAYRAKSAAANMERLHPEALAKQEEQAELDKANPSPFIETPKTEPTARLVPEELPPVNRDSVEISKLQKTVAELRQQLDERSNQRDIRSARLRKEIQANEQKLSRLAVAPLRTQVENLNRQIQQLQGERDAMSLALSRTQKEAAIKQAKTQRRLATALDALAEANRARQEIESVSEEQALTNAQVVAGQQAQIDSLRAKVAEQESIIAETRKNSANLEQQLNQSQSMVADLQQERDSLIEERDQMKLLLKMREDDRIQALISQNVALSKDFNEAKANLQALQDEVGSKREVILTAKRELVIAKAKIENLRSSNDEANARLEKMEKRLKQTEADLLAQLEGNELNRRGQAEVAMLRGIIVKKSAKIRAQRGMAELLLAEAKRMGEVDPTLQEAMAQIEGDRDTELTIDEMELLETQPVNPNLNNNFRPSAGELRQGSKALRELKENLNQVVQRLFSRQDFQAARGALQLIVEEDPGAWEAMINLGITHLRLDDSLAAESEFRRAILIAGDRKIPFAHFMLGDALYRQGQYDGASVELRESLALQPENAQAHILLGNISGKTNQIDNAEFHFKEAITQNPNLIEPYFNLSIIYRNQGKKELAMKFYTDYLRKGGPASLAHEALLGG